MLDLKDVWTEYRETGQAAIRDRIITDCIPLVKYVVGKVAAGAPPHCDREELIQSGIFGLIDAVNRYDPSKNVKFETYAILRIRGAVIDELRSRDWVPRGKRRTAREVEALVSELGSPDGSAPTVDELAAAMDVSPDEMLDILDEASVVSFVSLDEAQGSGPGEADDGPRLSKLVRDRAAVDPSDRLEDEERVRALAQAIVELPEQERIVVTLYYYEDLRLKDIGELFGVSESRVSQIHGRALAMLKTRMRELLGD